MSEGTADVVMAAQAGDEQALAELFSAHLPMVYSVVGSALDGHPDVDDVVQETMVNAVRGLPGLREPDRFPSWLATIAYREIQRNQRSKRTIAQRRRDLPADPPDANADFAERTVTGLLLAAQRRELAEAARWLDAGDRQLLSLWWQEQVGRLDRDGTAEQLTVGTGLLGMRMLRMKGRLEAARSVVRALAAAPRCAELGTVLRDWHGEVTSVWRKRLVRHVRDCDRCVRYRHGLIAPERLLLGAAVLPIPAGLGTGVPVTATPVWSAVQKFCSGKVLAGAAAVTVATGGGFAYAVHVTPVPDGEPQALARPPAVAIRTPSAPPSRAAATSAPAARPSGAPAGTGVAAADIYVAPGGSDSGSGTLERPFGTLAKAVATVRPGQTIAMRGGTYRPTATVVIRTSGTADRRITLSNYRGERPVIDAGRVPDEWAVNHKAAYWTVQGLEIKNSTTHAYVCTSCRSMVFQRLSMHGNRRSGLTLTGEGTVGNQVLNSDFFRNYDPAAGGGAGAGLAVQHGSGAGNVIRGNRAFHNADNGFDLSGFASPVTLDHNWAYGNGVNRWNVAGWQSNGDGFHLGGGATEPAAAHTVRDNAAWDNVNDGFSNSTNRGALRLTNNTALRNGRHGFRLLETTAGALTDNVASGNSGDPVRANAGATQRGNIWQDAAALFRSTDAAVAQGPRAADGTLPRSDFLVPAGSAGADMSAG
ncbi:sigma-70 family RNA polymerase sigma factor [Paractinoplanes rishiriensis]|uniref:RNA polymerase sigma factor n=1 Tax=Paractinoplanes rishiriensis TaxID=1050105 RepID=A0A919MTP0_9ACTN|nr:sigma-70 family RNA polymerase sigma factor [Actinoplanes rishiriensis]GIE99456.1 hypothetical protein Ari01nite_69210 [Actinoplanes rishiriensis]